MSIGVLLSDPDALADTEVCGCPEVDDDAESVAGVCSAGESSEQAVAVTSRTPVTAVAVRARRRV
jgi:hypothetical protein